MEKIDALETTMKIESLIYEIRGQKVMLDRDLAKLYGVSTGNLNKAVKRNIERFPERYMFQLTTDENLKFQNGISSWGGSRSLPYVFTEQGVAMLSSVLHSSTAIQVSMYPHESDETWRRETEALVRMNKHLPCSTHLLLTMNEEDTIKIDDITIHMIPIWKWLLN